MNRRLAIAALVGVFCAGIGFALFGTGRIATLDFRAFYCAGLLTREHSDPYRTQPLHDCEVRRTGRNSTFYDRSITLPAPQPVYDLPFFALFSMVPFDTARALWGALLVLALAGTCAALVRLTRLPATVVLCALLPTFIGPSLALGQIIPLYAVAAVSAMLFVSQKRYELAAVAAVASLIEPHLGLPICISLALWAPRTRSALALSVAVLAILALAFGGVAENAEYFSKVLPLHALSELPADGQLSFSVLLHGLGVSDKAALTGGTISYVAVSVFTIALASRAAVRMQSDAVLAALPAAGAVLGGTFVHGTDVVAAIPLALILAARTPAGRILAAVALTVLAVYWGAALEPAAGLAPWYALCAISTAYVLYFFTRKTPLAAVAALMIFGVLFEINRAYIASFHEYLQSPHATLAGIDPRYPEASWGAAIRERFSTGAACVWIVRVLTWSALVFVVGASTRKISADELPPAQPSADPPFRSWRSPERRTSSRA